MWCGYCRQEVPGIVSASDEGKICCARCSHQIAEGRDAPPGDPAEATEEPVFESVDSSGVADSDAPSVADGLPMGNIPPVDPDSWKLTEDLDRAGRLIRAIRGYGSADSASTVAWLDPPHDAAAPWHARRKHPASTGAATPRAASVRRNRRRPLFSYLVLALGVSAFVAGGVLAAWAMAAERGDLWSIGLPLALAGQAGLILGAAMLMDCLWRNSRRTTDVLDDLDERLSDLKQTTALMSTTHSTAAQSFYAHMAEGAGAELLLADLKGQLDMLAVKLARDRG